MKPSAISRCVHDSHDHRFCAAVVHRPYGTAVLHPYAHPYAVWRSGLPLECRFRSAAVLLEATLVGALSAEAAPEGDSAARALKLAQLGRAQNRGVTQNQRDAKIRHDRLAPKTAPLSQNISASEPRIAPVVCSSSQCRWDPRRWACHGHGLGGFRRLPRKKLRSRLLSAVLLVASGRRPESDKDVVSA
jgi:hypothetical protein